MRTTQIISGGVVILLLSACAMGPQLHTRDQWLAATSRVYEGVGKENILRAAETVFRLADGDDFTISHEPDGLYATRQWMVYLVLMVGMGTDYWTVRARNIENGAVHVSVTASTQSQAASVSQPTLSGGTPSLSPVSGAQVTDQTLYRLFWARMDYLLGIRPDWLTCDDASALYNVSRTMGGFVLLCNPLNVADNKPTGPILQSTRIATVPSAPGRSVGTGSTAGRVDARDEAARAGPRSAGVSDGEERSKAMYSGIQFPHPPGPRPPPQKVGVMSFEVEKLAKTHGCDGPKGAELLTEPGPIETYRVKCGPTEELILKCEYRECRILK